MTRQNENSVELREELTKMQKKCKQLEECKEVADKERSELIRVRDIAIKENGDLKKILLNLNSDSCKLEIEKLEKSVKLKEMENSDLRSVNTSLNSISKQLEDRLQNALFDCQQAREALLKVLY